MPTNRVTLRSRLSLIESALVQQFDLVVIGAGPAGCAAAIKARLDNLHVVVLETNAEPKIAPGETLHPGIEPILMQLGVAEEVIATTLNRHRGIRIKQNGHQKFVDYGNDENGPWLGFQVNRKRFHEILQRKVRDTGAILRTGCTATGISNANGRISGVTTSQGDFESRWVIDATGRTAWGARQMQIEPTVRSPPLKVRFGWRDASEEEASRQTEFEFCQSGWDWIAPLEEHRIAWAELRAAQSGEPSPSGMDVTWTIRSECAGPGYFLAGDAAARLDPASSHGVLRAMMSGILCSHLISGCLRNPQTANLENLAVQAYREWMTELFERDAAELRKLYEQTGIFEPDTHHEFSQS